MPFVKNPNPHVHPDFSEVEAKIKARHKPQPEPYVPYVPEIKPIKPCPIERLEMVLTFFVQEFPTAKICVENGFIEIFDAIEPPPPLNPYESVPVYKDDFWVEVIFNGRRKTFHISPPRPKRTRKPRG